MHNFRNELDSIECSGRYRSPEIIKGINFSSNDYLGFSEDLTIRNGLIQFLSRTKRIGSTGSRLLSGQSEELEEVETFLANTFGTESCLIFGSGYLASLGICAALDTSETEFISDELIHASWIDGMRLTRGKKTIVSHSDLGQFEAALARSSFKRKVVVTESIFSMDGDKAPIGELQNLAAKYDALLVVDEAHATGVLGTHGLGAVSEMNPERSNSTVIALHTAGKSLGAYGAFVCCSEEFKELMINKSRSQIFSTALSPVAVEHIRLAVQRMRDDSEPTARLRRNIDHFQKLFKKIGLPTSDSQIVPVRISGNKNVLTAAHYLQKQGFGVKAIRSPTVSPGKERLRMSITANHSAEELTALASALVDTRGVALVDTRGVAHNDRFDSAAPRSVDDNLNEQSRETNESIYLERCLKNNREAKK